MSLANITFAYCLQYIYFVFITKKKRRVYHIEDTSLGLWGMWEQQSKPSDAGRTGLHPALAAARLGQDWPVRPASSCWIAYISTPTRWIEARVHKKQEYATPDLFTVGQCHGGIPSNVTK